MPDESAAGVYKIVSRIRVALLVLSTIILAASTAQAHPGHSHGSHESGLVAGLLHPLLGLDHLLAMVAVGLIAAQLSRTDNLLQPRRAVWLIPGAFLLSMIAGGVFGMQGAQVGGIEYGIAASIVVLGSVIAWNRQAPIVVCLTGAAIFGLFHGHAHGAEMPAISQPALYALGFVLTTTALHVAGVVGGRVALRTGAGATGLRLAGVAIAMAGIVLIAVH